MTDESQDEIRRPTEARNRGCLSPRSGCLLGILALALTLAAVYLIGTLVTRGEVVIARGEPQESRLWLVSDGANQGLAYSIARRVRPSSTYPDEVCYRTRVHFVLWKSQGSTEGGSYCSCFRRVGDGWQEVGPCLP